jgi:NTP pyrophosphatase (non-canonical NTP hydrolase)
LSTMPLCEHAALVRSLAKPGCDIIRDLTPESTHILHMAVGVAGEAGEVLELAKKHSVYGKPLNRDNLVEELGDLEFYMEGLRQEVGITREECLLKNIAKLTKRYSNGYTNAAAISRVDK